MARGYLNFVAGSAPSEADWDDFIGRQVVGVFDDATDRDTQIGDEVVEGMRAVTADDGIEWIAVRDPLAVDPTTASDFTWSEFGRYKAWDTSHSPTLTATGTNPTIGTGPVLDCRWTKEGTLATVVFYVAFGTGMAAGTGTYEIDLPPECPAAPSWYGAEEYVAGNGIAIDSSTGTRQTVAVKIVGATTIRLEADGLTSSVTESNLISWGDSDVVLSGTITYETEEVY
jgi:hypothetical protein